MPAHMSRTLAIPLLLLLCSPNALLAVDEPAPTTLPALPADVRAKLDEKLQPIEREIERRRAKNPAAADVLRRDLAAVRDLIDGNPAPTPADAPPDVHVV